MNNYPTSTLLRNLRTKYDYKIEQIASLLGVSKAAISKWENNGDISLENLYTLSKIYNVSFSELCNGKLNYESNNDYWKRNYDLSNYEIPDKISNKNIENVKIFFEHCSMVKRRFFELLPLWAKDKLSNEMLEEFEFIKSYFKFDDEYYIKKKSGFSLLYSGSKESEKKFVQQITLETQYYSEEASLWELQKLYNFNYDIKEETIRKSGDLKALEWMLSSFNQIEKDSILYANLYIKQEYNEKKLTLDEIEERPFMKIIINSGANVLYGNNNHEFFDEEMLEKIDGKKEEVDESVYNKYSFYIYHGITEVPILNCWKLFSYEQYLDFIDHKTTEKLKDVVNLRESSPLKYYENMLKREGINER